MIQWLQDTGEALIETFATIFAWLDQPVMAFPADTLAGNLILDTLNAFSLIDLTSLTWMDLILEMVPVAIILGIFGALWKAFPGG